MDGQRPSLPAVIGALQRVADAVHCNDWAGYNAAVAAARAIGCTHDQIEEVYRSSRSYMLRGPSFDLYGRIT